MAAAAAPPPPPLLLLGRGPGSYRQTYTWESSLAHTTYFPSGVNDAEIWLLVFKKPNHKKHGQRKNKRR